MNCVATIGLTVAFWPIRVLTAPVWASATLCGSVARRRIVKRRVIAEWLVRLILPESVELRSVELQSAMSVVAQRELAARIVPQAAHAVIEYSMFDSLRTRIAAMQPAVSATKTFARRKMALIPIDQRYDKTTGARFKNSGHGSENYKRTETIRAFVTAFDDLWRAQGRKPTLAATRNGIVFAYVLLAKKSANQRQVDLFFDICGHGSVTRFKEKHR